MLKLFVWLLLICGGFAACDSDDPWPYTEDSYSPTFWDLTYEGYGNVVLVNSDEELEKYFIGTDYPVIDFSQKSLLLVSGTATSGITQKTVSKLRKLSPTKYKLDVQLVLSLATVMERWVIGLTIDEIKDNSKIEVNVNTRY